MKQLMKQFAIFFTLMFVSLLAFAQVVSGGATVDVIVPTGEVLTKFVNFILSVKGMSSLAIAVAVVQLAVLFLKSELALKVWPKLTAAKKMTLVQGLTILATLFTTMTMGLDFGAALLSAAVIIPLQEYLVQLYKNYLAKKNS